MAKIPPGMWENPDAYQPREVYDPGEDLHQHDENCGHEAVQHGDHVDYVHGGKHHWWNGHHWAEH